MAVGHPRERWRVHRGHARDRGIEFTLTFEEWWKIWQDSGHWDQRGQGSNEYCMARHNDTGPYAVGNVSIITSHVNNKASQSRWSDARKQFQSRVMKGNHRGVRSVEQAGELPVPPPSAPTEDTP